MPPSAFGATYTDFPHEDREASKFTKIHGDLHARNILVLNGRLSGVVDWGDACRGDRATDLASVWMLFGDSAVRASALDACGATRPTRARARAWAIYFATMFAHAGLASDARHASLGAGILERVASDHRSNQSRGAAP